MEDLPFFKNTFKTFQDQLKKCMLMVDEICVKASLTYYGNQSLGKAVNNEDKIATTACTVTKKALFGGLDIVNVSLPVCGLTSEFFIE